MKILHTVQYYYPRAGGSEQVVQQLSEALVARGHQVTVATAADPQRQVAAHNGVGVAGFAVRGNSAVGIRGPDKDRYIQFVEAGGWDVMMNYAAQIWCSDLLFPRLERIRCAKVLVPCGYSGLQDRKTRWLYWNYFRRLPAYLRRYDALVYHTELGMDKAFGDAKGVNQKYVVIPNGVPEAEFAEPGIDFRAAYGIRTRYFLLNVSNHLWLKGHRALLEMMRRLPRQDVTLVMLGQGSQECHAECLEAERRSGGRIRAPEGVPRSHVVSAFREADLFVFASRLEYFPLVLLEAMAARTPFVTTRAGNAGELRGGVIAATPPEMARQVDRLLEDRSERERLANQGHADWQARYRWERIVDAYEALYLRLARIS